MMNYIKSVLPWLIGIFFLIIFFPLSFVIWLVVYPFDKKRKVIHWLLVWQSTLLTYIMPVWSIRIEGREKAKRNSTYIIISNHQSILDILLINCLRYRFKWVSKIENTKVPFLGWYLRMADYLIVDRNNDESKAGMLARAYMFLKEGTSVMFFPEGTRSVDGNMGFFKHGAFQLALETKVPVLPVVVHGTGGILPKKSIVFRGKSRLFIRVLEPVHPSSFGTDDPDELAMKFRELITSELSKMRTGNGTKS